MPDEWPGDVNRVYEVSTKGGSTYVGTDGFDTVVNAFLERGWRIVQTYVKRSEGKSDDCVFVMGWRSADEPEYPPGYGEPDPNELDEDFEDFEE